MESLYSPLENINIQRLIEVVPLFTDLPEQSLQKVTSHIVVRSHVASQVILLENDWGSSVYFILEGWVKIRTHNLDGKEITLNILGKGELFGEMAALEELPRSTDAITLTPTTIATIPAQDFISLIYSEPLAGVYLTKLMARRLRQINRRLQLREADSLARVVDAVLFLVYGQGKQGTQGIEIPNLPHREISSLSGLARETVTRALTKLEQKGLIRREGDLIFIPSVIALERTIN